jgi:YVTN family beta-propeller protein
MFAPMTLTARRIVLAATIALAAAALPAAQSSGPQLLVLNKTDATLAFVDPASGRVTGTVPTGDGPHEVVVSADGKLAFASNYGATVPTISVIDIATKKELRRVDVSPLRRPHGLAFADGKLYFTAELNRLFARYDPATNQIDWMLGTGQTTTHMILVNEAATRIYTANIGGNSIALFERGANPQNWSETVIPVGRGPEGFDVSPDGRELWAAHSQDGGVSVIDLATKKVAATLDLKTGRSNRLKFTTDGTRVLISDLNAGEIVVVDAKTHEVVKKIPVGKSPEGILMAPGGLVAYVAVNGDNFVAVLDLKTLNVTKKIETGGGPDGMAWAIALGRVKRHFTFQPDTRSPGRAAPASFVP